jgi:predicted  nucleic acid-binding Zn-ribbon protein
MMLETIEKLLILQDRDKHIRQVKSELAQIDPERQSLTGKAAGAQATLEHAKQKVREFESQRKQLELEVESKKQLIEKYSNQQLQTRKNEEYRALAHEIDTCKADITKIEDRQIELMEQTERVQKEVAGATQVLNEAKKLGDSQITQLGQREQSLKKELADLEANREELAAAVEETVRARYERLVKNRGDTVIVGVQHGVCGGCHMKLPAQILVSCRAAQELITCNNCGRILYYTRDMDLAVTE